MATRADFYSIDFMMESTPGTDPGIVAASYVDGTDTTEGKYVPNLTNGDKAFALLAAAPEGLPDLKTVEVPEAKVVRDHGNKRLPGLKNEGEFTLTFNLHGWAATPSTQVPAPPPWLQLASAGCGHIFGNVAASDDGGAATTIASVGPDNVTAGTVVDGHVFGVKDANASTTTLQLVRPDDAASTEVTTYQIDTAFTKATSDPVYFSAQTHFDYRNDAIGPVGGSSAPTTYTILLHRPDIASCMMFFGCRANKVEIDAKVGEVPQVKVTFIFETWSVQSDGGSEWSGYSVLTSKPQYNGVCYDDIWPDPEVTQYANLVWVDTADSNARKAPHISEFSWMWEAGYTRYNANTGAEGVGGVYATGQQRVTMKYKTLFDEDWRAHIGAYPFPVMYWQGRAQGRVWFCGITAAQMVEGPGLGEEVDGNQANSISLEGYDYCDDADAYAAGKPAQCIGYLGVL